MNEWKEGQKTHFDFGVRLLNSEGNDFFQIVFSSDLFNEFLSDVTNKPGTVFSLSVLFSTLTSTISTKNQQENNRLFKHSNFTFKGESAMKNTNREKFWGNFEKRKNYNTVNLSLSLIKHKKEQQFFGIQKWDIRKWKNKKFCLPSRRRSGLWDHCTNSSFPCVQR